mmetsp:Transcript_37259/g.59846  ORF Transcript_37259/g.59846 Transcript_37259/m.59846 type:complete len:231 (-) Transcript_37259:390-1082(-)
MSSSTFVIPRCVPPFRRRCRASSWEGGSSPIPPPHSSPAAPYPALTLFPPTPRLIDKRTFPPVVVVVAVFVVVVVVVAVPIPLVRVVRLQWRPPPPWGWHSSVVSPSIYCPCATSSPHAPLPHCLGYSGVTPSITVVIISVVVVVVVAVEAGLLSGHPKVPLEHPTYHQDECHVCYIFYLPCMGPRQLFRLDLLLAAQQLHGHSRTQKASVDPHGREDSIVTVLDQEVPC